MIRKLLLPLLVATAIAAAALAQEKWVPYESPRVFASKRATAYTIALPPDWTFAWGGDRARFYHVEAEGPYAAQVFVQVDAVARDAQGADGILAERDGLELWLGATRPRFELEDRRRVKVGQAGAQREAILVRDPARPPDTKDRRELIVLVPATDVLFLIRCSAPYEAYSAQDQLFKRILAGFEMTNP